MRISDWSSDVCSSDLNKRITQGPSPFGTVALGQAQARALPDLVAGRHTERTKMRKQRTQHMRLAGREQAQRRFVLAVIVRRNQIDGMGVVELVDLILSVDHRHIPTEQVDEEDRTSVVSDKSVSVRVDLGCSRLIKKKK